MAEETKQRNKKSALAELKKIQEEDRAAGIHYNEPELKHFDAQSVFDVNDKKTKNKPERKSAFHIGKRSNRKTTRVQVHSQAFENSSFEIEDVTLEPKPKRHEAKPTPAEQVQMRQVEQMKETLSHEQDVPDEKVEVWKPKEEKVEVVVEPEEVVETPEPVIEPHKPAHAIQEEPEEQPEEILEPQEEELDEELEVVEEPEEPIEKFKFRQAQQMKASLAHEKDAAEEKVEVWKPKTEKRHALEEEKPSVEEPEAKPDEDLVDELEIVDKTTDDQKEAANVEAPVDVDEKAIESLVQKPEANPDHDDIELVKVDESKEDKPKKESLEISLDEVLQVVDASKSIDTSDGKVMELDQDDDIDVVDVEAEESGNEDQDENNDDFDIPVMDMEQEEDQQEGSNQARENDEIVEAKEADSDRSQAVQVQPNDEEEEDIEVIQLDDEEDVKQEPEGELEETPEGELFEEKKSFLLSQYKKEEDFLEAQSQNGFHYVRHEGKRFVFAQGDPKDYYYLLNYYEKEPDAATKAQWRREGWRLISVSPSKDKKAAGWFVLRNEEQPGEYRKTIDNEEEKYEFFRKYRNSTRSTMFLIFIIMIVCVVTAVLQVIAQAQGFFAGRIGMAGCAVLFIIAAIFFIKYSRMLHGATKQANLLRARLRLRQREQGTDDTKDETDEQLDLEWDKVDEE